MLKRRLVGDLPDEMVVALIRTLFGMLQSLVVSVACTTIVSAKVAWDSGQPALTAITFFIATCGALRIVLLVRFNRADRPTLGRATALRWEWGFGVLTSLHCLGVGGLVLLTFTLTDYTADHMLVANIACGVAAGAMCRNAGSPRIASVQIILLISPLVIACLLQLQWSYFILGMINILFTLACLEIILNINTNMIDLLSITQEKTNLAASIVAKNEIVDAVLGNMSHGLCLLDAQQRLVIANSRFQVLLDLPDPLMVPGTRLQEAMSHVLADRGDLASGAPCNVGFGAVLEEGQERATILRLRDDRCLSVSRRPMADGGMVILFEDVTEQQRSEARVAHLATHDALTDLPNRTVFEDRLRSELTKLHSGTRCVLMYLDLDRFKTVNDTLGHSAGDLVLCETARRILAVVGPDRLVTRIGGDEFVVLATDLDEQQTVVLAQAIIAAIKQPYRLGMGEVKVGISIGAALANDPTQSAAELRHAADLALYKAKNDGRGTVHLFSARTCDEFDGGTGQRLSAVGWGALASGECATS